MSSLAYQEMHTTFPMHTKEVDMEVDMFIFLGECRMGPRRVGRCKVFVELSQRCIRGHYGSTFDIHTDLIADPEGNKMRSVEWHHCIQIIMTGCVGIQVGLRNAKSNHARYVVVSRAVRAPSFGLGAPLRPVGGARAVRRVRTFGCF